MDKVFVITVCWNAGDLLEPTMLSVLNQTYDNLAYIIVDGGSSDGSIDVIRKYEDRLAAWVSEPDNGIYDAMNKGLRMAKKLLADGESAWVNFMNAGDRFSDSHVVNDFFCQPIPSQTKVMIGHFNRCEGKQKILKKADEVDYLPAWMPFCHQATFVRLDCCRFDTKYRIAADYNMFYNLYFDEGRDVFLTKDRVVADFRMEDSTTYSNLRKTKWEILTIQSRHKSWFWVKDVVKYILNKNYNTSSPT